MPAFHRSAAANILRVFLLTIPAVYLCITNFMLFVPSLYFVIHALTAVIFFLAAGDAMMNVPIVSGLIPLGVYLAVVLSVPVLKRHVLWLQAGQLNRSTITLSVILFMGSAAALALWSLYCSDNIHRFRTLIPELPMGPLVIYALFFSILNATFQEFLGRAILYDGFYVIFGRIVPAIVCQACVFALWHFNGFPGGVLGMCMVFVWSLLLGAVRYTSRGILIPLLAHIFAEWIIALILLFMIVLPGLQ